MDEFRSRLREMLGPRLRDLRIYGSKVRGTSDPESDIDLLVLVEALDPATWGEVVDLALSVSPVLSPHVDDYDGYHEPRSRASGFYKEIRRESVRL